MFQITLEQRRWPRVQLQGELAQQHGGLIQGGLPPMRSTLSGGGGSTQPQGWQKNGYPSIRLYERQRHHFYMAFLQQRGTKAQSAAPSSTSVSMLLRLSSLRWPSSTRSGKPSKAGQESQAIASTSSQNLFGLMRNSTSTSETSIQPSSTSFKPPLVYRLFVLSNSKQ